MLSKISTHRYWWQHVAKRVSMMQNLIEETSWGTVSLQRIFYFMGHIMTFSIILKWCYSMKIFKLTANRFSYFKGYLLSFEELLKNFYYVQFVKVEIIEFRWEFSFCYRDHEDLRTVHHISGEGYGTKCCGLSWCVV